MRSFLGGWACNGDVWAYAISTKNLVLAHIGLSHFVLSLYNAGYEPASPYEGQC